MRRNGLTCTGEARNIQSHRGIVPSAVGLAISPDAALKYRM
nr:MAG TPA: hypothetical protein [Caudoviricetes sp.]